MKCSSVISDYKELVSLINQTHDSNFFIAYLYTKPSSDPTVKPAEVKIPMSQGVSTNI